MTSDDSIDPQQSQSGDYDAVLLAPDKAVLSAGRVSITACGGTFWPCVKKELPLRSYERALLELDGRRREIRKVEFCTHSAYTIHYHFLFE